MNRTQLLRLQIGDRVKNSFDDEKGTVTGFIKYDKDPDEWDMSDVFTDNDEVTADPQYLIVLRKKQQKTVAIEWFARGSGLVRMGPFKSQLKAWEAIMSVDDPTRPVGNAIVWCSRKK